jgi:hypothetical protein
LQLRVLDAKVARLELQLKDEVVEKITSCSELVDEIIATMPHISSCSAALREELHKARAKRDKIYQHYLLNQQQEIQGSNDSAGGGGAAPPPPPHADEAPPPAAADAPAPPPHADEAPPPAADAPAPPPADDAMSS